MTPGSNIRAFLALTLPAEVRKSVFSIGERLRSSDVQAAWEPEEKLHITVRFLGHLSPDSLQKVTSEIQPITAEVRPFDILFTHVGAFPHAKTARVIWCGAHKSDTLMRLMKDAEDACRRAGLEPENRQPHPHCTLARVKRNHENPNLTALLKSVTFDPILTRASELTLMKSVLHQRGSTHSMLTSFPFIRTRSSHE